jgi:tripartite-type tricarboxylate transporter receptor subunit TctC
MLQINRGGHSTLPRVILAAAFACLACSAACAQAFPSKGVRVISPYPAGSGPDQMMRAVVEQLTTAWKQPVVLDSRPGGNGIPAMEAIKAAPPDGHTLAVASDAQLAINPFLYRALSYDPHTDLAPVTLLFSTPFYLVVAANGAYRTLPDLIADARSAPNKVSYGTLLVGSSTHLGSELFASLINAQMLFVPYRDPQQMMVNIAKGDLGWTFSTVATATPMVDGGLLRFLAVARHSRTSSLPEVPTMAEAGGPELEVKSWLSLVAPRGTPTDVIAKINKDVIGLLATPSLQDRLRSFGFTSEAGGTPEYLTKIMREDMARNGELIKRTGASVQ